ncbi:DUF882 domain-containing protein [bacterium]|nr:DUF882 domain-containing protein [bacterium]
MKSANTEKTELDRRGFIRLGLIAAASAIISPHEAVASLGTKKAAAGARDLLIHNLHTEEHIHTTYYRDGRYLKDSMGQLNHIFRDHYNGRVRRIDPRLMDLLFAIKQRLGADQPFELISGYRSPKTNENLRSKNKKVAKKSMHVYGKAADIRLPGVSLKDLRRAAYEIQGGGVGYYPKSNFVHVDVGRVRFW